MIQLRNDLTFEQFWEQTKGCYKSLEVRCIAEETQDLWQNVMFSGFGTRQEPEEAKRRADQDYAALRDLGLEEISILGLFHEVSSPERTPQFVEQVKSGEISFGNQKVRLRDGYSFGNPWPASEQSLTSGDFTDFPVIQIPINSRAGAGSSIRLYNELVAHGVMNGVDELGSRWLRLSQVSARNLNGQLFFPLYLGSVDVALAGRKLSLYTKAHKEIADRLRLMAVLRRLTPTGVWAGMESKSFSGKDMSYGTLDSGVGTFKLEHQFQTSPVLDDEIDVRGSGELGVLLSENWHVRDLIPAKQYGRSFADVIVQLVGADELEAIIEGRGGRLFREKTNPGVEFERAVAYVLGMVGMQNAQLGDTHGGVVKRKDGADISDVDIIAQDSETKIIYVVQCTINPPDRAKVDVISNAAEELGRRGIYVEPLVVVGDKAGEVKRNSRRVKVIDREDLSRMLRLLIKGKVAEAKRIVTRPSVS